MAAEYRTEPITGTSVSERWGLDPVQYVMTEDKVSQLIDFQDLMINISLQRAAVLEGEVQPLAQRVEMRNKKLNAIGNAISELSNISPMFDTSKTNPDANIKGFSPQSISIYREVYALAGRECPKSLTNVETTVAIYSITKSTVDEATQKLKSWSERLNNDSQLNMQRMNTLVSHRDQTNNTATSMMNHISDVIGFVIKSMN